jgi:RNA-directed DNA polymerase
MIKQVLNRRNLQKALEHVMQNKGSAGVDKMALNELSKYVRENINEITLQIESGNYLSNPILGKEIAKSNGKTRLLGIPTVIDRWLQQSVLQVITLGFEQEFLPSSFGFRPNKNAHQCVLQSQQFINDGYQHIVDIDLKNFFDEVDHCLLLERLYAKVKCPITLRLIRKWLRVPISINGKLHKRRKGVPQGSPLSPLLSNIMLHELDKLMAKRKMKYVRYADDFSIYCKTKSEAKKIGNDIFLFLKEKLKLPINREKSGIRKPVQFEILGHKFVSTYEKGVKGKYQLVVSQKSWEKLKMNLKSVTRKTSPISLSERNAKLKEIHRGWVNYFRMANIHGKLRDIDSWVRNRLRYCIWHDWKKPERRRKNFIRLGIDQDHAYAWSRTRMGGWRVAQSPMMLTTITKERLAKKGYESILDYYKHVLPVSF